MGAGWGVSKCHSRRCIKLPFSFKQFNVALFGMNLLSNETLLSHRGQVEFVEPTVAIVELKT